MRAPEEKAKMEAEVLRVAIGCGAKLLISLKLNQYSIYKPIEVYLFTL